MDTRVAPVSLNSSITLSPTVFDDAVAEPTSWLRFWFPDPEGSETEFQRAYTISEADTSTGHFAIDVVLHDPAGPASSWARTVEPGATVAAMSMGSKGFAVADDPAGPPRRIAVGRPARLCVLDRPLPAALASPEDNRVRAVMGPTGLLDVS